MKELSINTTSCFAGYFFYFLINFLDFSRQINILSQNNLEKADFCVWKFSFRFDNKNFQLLRACIRRVHTNVFGRLCEWWYYINSNRISLSHAMRPGLQIRHFWVVKSLFLTITCNQKKQDKTFCF